MGFYRISETCCRVRQDPMLGSTVTWCTRHSNPRSSVLIFVTNSIQLSRHRPFLVHSSKDSCHKKISHCKLSSERVPEDSAPQPEPGGICGTRTHYTQVYTCGSQWAAHYLRCSSILYLEYHTSMWFSDNPPHVNNMSGASCLSYRIDRDAFDLLQAFAVVGCQGVSPVSSCPPSAH